MMCYGGKDLAAALRTVRTNTIAIAEDIPEDKYGFKPAPESRSVARLLTHIALGPTFQHQIHSERRTTIEGFDFPGLFQRLMAEEQVPRTKAQIVDLLKQDGETLAAWLEGLPDEFLGELVAMHPGSMPSSKTRFEMLMSIKEHEMHHRGQLMLIERLLGIVPHLTRQRQERMTAAQQRAGERRP